VDKYEQRINEGDWIFDGDDYYKVQVILKRQFNRLYAKFVNGSGECFKTYLTSNEMTKMSQEDSFMLELSKK